MLATIPVAIALLLGALGIQYDPRYVAFCAAPYYILVARGLTELRLGALRWTGIFLSLLFSVYALRANYFIPYKENHRDSLAHIAANYRQGDCCIFLPFQTLPLEWSVYYPGGWVPRMTTPETLTQQQPPCKRVWLTVYERVLLPEAIQGRKLIDSTYRKVDVRRSFWVDVDLYEPR
jgi:hypothetical protein